MSRPRQPVTRDRIIALRLTAVEHAALSKAARADRRTLSDWLRLVALDAAKGSR